MVKITEYCAVISTVISGWVIAVIIIGQVDQALIVVQSRTISFPHARQSIIMATKHIQLSIVVNVGKIASLHEHTSVVKIKIRPLSDCIDVLHVDAVV